jgi:hypothetical protein
MNQGTLPQFVYDLLSERPYAGQGVHNYLFRVALKTAPYWDEQAIFAWLREYGDDCGRYVSDKEIFDAINAARPRAWQGRCNGLILGSFDCSNLPATTTPRPAPPWPSAEPDLIESIALDGPSLAGLREMSPTKCSDSAPDAEEVVSALFPGDPWLCCGRTTYDFDTRRRNEWRGVLSSQALIVPSPMLGPYGFTQDGRVSAHAKSSVSQRVYLVVECDFAEKSRDGKHDTPMASLIRDLAGSGIGILDICAAVLSQAGQFAPWALVVHSGGKSLHGWFSCAEVDEGMLREFFAQCCRLGADPRTWLPSQFVRMPGGTRHPDNGIGMRRRQDVASSTRRRLDDSLRIQPSLFRRAACRQEAKVVVTAAAAQQERA